MSENFNFSHTDALQNKSQQNKNDTILNTNILPQPDKIELKDVYLDEPNPNQELARQEAVLKEARRRDEEIQQRLKALRAEVASLNNDKSPEEQASTRQLAKEKLIALKDKPWIKNNWAKIIKARNNLREWYNSSSSSTVEGSASQEEVAHLNKMHKLANNHRAINRMEKAIKLFDKLNRQKKELQEVTQHSTYNDIHVPVTNDGDSLEVLEDKIEKLNINKRIKELDLLYEKIERKDPEFMRVHGSNSRLNLLTEEAYGILQQLIEQKIIEPSDEPDTEEVDFDPNDIIDEEPVRKEEVVPPKPSDHIQIFYGDEELDSFVPQRNIPKDLPSEESFDKPDALEGYHNGVLRQEVFKKYKNKVRNSISEYGYYLNDDSREQARIDVDRQLETYIGNFPAEILGNKTELEEQILYADFVPKYLTLQMNNLINDPKNNELLEQQILNDYAYYAEKTAHENHESAAAYQRLNQEGVNSIDSADIQILVYSIYIGKLAAPNPNEATFTPAQMNEFRDRSQVSEQPQVFAAVDNSEFESVAEDEPDFGAGAYGGSEQDQEELKPAIKIKPGAQYESEAGATYEVNLVPSQALALGSDQAKVIFPRYVKGYVDLGDLDLLEGVVKTGGNENDRSGEYTFKLSPTSPTLTMSVNNGTIEQVKVGEDGTSPLLMAIS